MPSCPRNPQDPCEEPFDPGAPNPQTPSPGAFEPSQKRFRSQRLEPLSQTEKALRKRSPTQRLPTPGPETLHTRVTLPRTPSLKPSESAEDAETGLWFIAGSNKPGALKPEKPKGLSSFKVRAQMALLAGLVLLLGAQAFLAHLAGNCADAQANRGQQNCFTLSLFTTHTDAVAQPQPAAPKATKTATKPAIPAVPDDLPGNVHDFVALALPYAIETHHELGWPTSVFLAQWGFEHGWQAPDAQGYNWGNTTYAPGCPYHGSRFCYASTPEEGVREYVYTARLSYYDGVRAAAPKGANATALALGQSPWDGGHYGGADNPGSKLLEIMQDFNFYRFDTGA